MILLLAQILESLGFADLAGQVSLLSPISWLVMAWVYLMAMVMSGG